MTPEDWKVLSDVADSLTVVAVLVIDLYVIIFSGKLVTRAHMDDVTKGMEQRNTDLQGERDRAVQRENEARRELAENNQVLDRLDGTVREALQALSRRR